MKNFRTYEQGQGSLFPPRVGELIPDRHRVRVFNDIIDRLDLRPLDANYKTSGVNSGAPAWHPAMLLKLLFRGYAHGIRASRQLAEFARFDVRAMWLCGEQRPKHAAIANFRTRHANSLAGVFVQILGVAAELGIDSCGHWAIDGTRVLANAGRKAIADGERLEAERDRLQDEIDAALREAAVADRADATLFDDDDDPDSDDDNNGYDLPPELRRKQDRVDRIEAALRRLRETKSRTANATDPDAPTMARTDLGVAAPAFNAQLTVDVGSGLIVACDVTDRHTDSGQLLPQLDQAIANTGGKPAAVLADTGYASGPGFAGLVERDRKERQYTEAGSCSRTVYRCTDCAECPLAAACKRSNVKRRTLRVSEHEPLQESMRARMATKDGKAAYVKRKSSVEPAFGTLKSARGFRRFLLRGRASATAEWCLVCSAFNVTRLVRLAMAPAPSPSPIS